MRFHDKTAYVWGLRYRWDPLLSRNLIPRFPHFKPPWKPPHHSTIYTIVQMQDCTNAQLSIGEDLTGTWVCARVRDIRQHCAILDSPAVAKHHHKELLPSTRIDLQASRGASRWIRVRKEFFWRALEEDCGKGPTLSSQMFGSLLLSDCCWNLLRSSSYLFYHCNLFLFSFAQPPHSWSW